MNTVFVLLMNQAPGQALTLIRPSATFSLIGRRKWGAIPCVRCVLWVGLCLAKRLVFFGGFFGALFGEEFSQDGDALLFADA